MRKRETDERTYVQIRVPRLTQDQEVRWGGGKGIKIEEGREKREKKLGGRGGEQRHLMIFI
jgi:hypothetical protein